MLQGYVGVLLEICFFRDPRGEASLLICRYDENPKILDIFSGRFHQRLSLRLSLCFMYNSDYSS